ncbi:MAG: hypothetical protein JNK78_04660 [Planctomycetes bacterium]|nr:hypothetical protein [Planctomycetota bacterium]
MFAARHLRPGSHAVVGALRRRGRDVWPLHRRGADLGFVVAMDRTMPSVAAAKRRWDRSEPVFLPGILDDAPEFHERAIDASLRMFDRLRRGGRFLDEVERRVGDDPDLRYAGSTKDRSDPREVERVFVDAEPGGRKEAEDVWAKLAWIANDESDASLRIRFSAGKEQLEEWMRSTDLTASWVDRFAQRMFPECAAVLRCEPLRQMLDAMIARPHRLSERIVYNNAPDGGAVFHHDAEPGQIGVIFSQLEGHTAWLSLPKERLAALVVRAGARRTRRAAMEALDAGSDERLWRLLNRDAAFCAQLAARGALFVLRAGDSIALPSQSIDRVAWHSVFALGSRASLAHSYGLFPRRPDYPMAADPRHG